MDDIYFYVLMLVMGLGIIIHRYFHPSPYFERIKEMRYYKFHGKNCKKLENTDYKINRENNQIVEYYVSDSGFGSYEPIPKCEQEILLKMLEFGENIIIK